MLKIAKVLYYKTDAVKLIQINFKHMLQLWTLLFLCFVHFKNRHVMLPKEFTPGPPNIKPLPASLQGLSNSHIYLTQPT